MKLRPDSHLFTGDEAPDFQVLDADEGSFSLSDELKSAPIVLVFYPTDFGIVCTIELREFKEIREEIESMGYRIVWINTDSTASHRSWRMKAKVPFQMLSDPGGEVSKMYGIFLEEDGLLKNFSNRSIFVIEQDSRLSYRWVGRKPATSPPLDELLESLRRRKVRAE